MEDLQQDVARIGEMLLGKEGLKVDVTAKLSPDIYVKLFVTIVGAVIISALAVKAIDNVL